jgi:integrase
MPRKWIGRWEGGRIAQLGNEDRVYVIEQMADGERYSIALGAIGEKAALKLYESFRRDPEAFMKERTGEAQLDRPGLDTVTIQAFLDHLKSENRTLLYRQNLHHYLGQWKDWFRDRPLADVSTAELAQAILEWRTAARHRIIALKSYASYLRKKMHRLKLADDPTVSLQVPQAVPEKSIRAKGYTMEHVALVYRHIDEQHVRDVIALRALTGMHESEASRIALGKAEIRAVQVKCEIAGVIRFPHKRGEIHAQSVPAQALAAAQRLAARRWRGKITTVNNRAIRRELTAACARASEATGKPVALLMPGELRHSLVTWARQFGREVRPPGGGVSLDQIADAIGHKSKQTTTRFYDGTQVPPMILIPLLLKHPKDPPLTRAGGSPGSRRKVSRRRGAGDASAG